MEKRRKRQLTTSNSFNSANAINSVNPINLNSKSKGDDHGEGLLSFCAGAQSDIDPLSPTSKPSAGLVALPQTQKLFLLLVTGQGTVMGQRHFCLVGSEFF